MGKVNDWVGTPYTFVLRAEQIWGGGYTANFLIVLLIASQRDIIHRCEFSSKTRIELSEPGRKYLRMPKISLIILFYLDRKKMFILFLSSLSAFIFIVFLLFFLNHCF